MWWQPLFWILLIPLIIVEIIIFIKTKKVYWLMYALAIFVYVIAVSYTLDVFDAGRNAVILTLLASAVLMALIGRHLGQTKKKQKTVSRSALITTIVLLVFMILLFTVSVIFGQAAETVRPADAISEESITYPAGDEPVPVERDGPVILTRTLTNGFFLPVPVVQREYRVCAVTADGLQDLYVQQDYERHREVAPGSTEEIRVRVSRMRLRDDLQVSELRVYQSEEYTPCADRGQSDYVIPVE